MILNSFLRNPLDIGVSDDLSNTDKSRLRILNLALWIPFLVNLLLLFMFLFDGRIDLVLYNVVLNSIVSVVPWTLLLTGKIKVVKWIITFSYPLILFLLEWIYGDLEIQLFFTGTALVVMFIHEQKTDKVIALLWCALFYTLYVVLIHQNAHTGLGFLEFENYRKIVQNWVQVSGFLMHIIFFWVMLNEVTYNQDRLVERGNELKELNDRKNRFISIISHDLKGPFSGFVQLINVLESEMDELTKQEIKEMLGALNDSAVKSYALLQDLLELSRSLLGRHQVVRVDFDVSKMVHKSVDYYKNMLNHKEIDVVFKGDAMLMAHGDVNFFRGVIRNLFSNAIKFTHRGGQIVLSWKVIGSMVEIEVKDNGVGISEEKQKKLFNLAEVSTSLGTEKEEGTGLGLILCEEFVKHNGGELWYKSIPGKGTSFFFSLPVMEKS